MSTVAAGALIGCFECPAALVEADESLVAMGDTILAAVDGARGSPSIILKRWLPARCMAERAMIPAPMLASIMAIGCLT